jgi:hypothetical protein
LGNGLVSAIIGAIPQEEYDILIQGIYDTIDAFYKYRNSVLGVLEAVSQDYGNLNLDAIQIQENLGDPKNLEFLKDVMTKLG